MKYYLYLLQIFGGGNPRIHQVINYYGGAEQAYNAISDGDVSLVSKSSISYVKGASLEKSEYIIKHCEENNIHIYTIEDENYPSLLKNIYNPPVLLFVKGTLAPLENEVTLTVVGTRNPTPYSIKLGTKLCCDLAKINIVLVSGMAMGLDSIAHIEAVKHHTPTIGVLACGMDIDYPKGSNALRERIVMEGGAIISELLPGTSCNANYFKIRNRIMSGLGLGTLIIEASMSSGCLITANYAIQQGRDLFCVTPANVFSPHYSGVIQYLRDGAIPVFNHLDIINEYYSTFSHKLNIMDFESEFIQKTTDKFPLSPRKPKKQNSAVTNDERLDEVCSIESQAEIDTSKLSENHIKLIEILKNGPVQIDGLVEKSQLSHIDVCDLLTDLEIEGIVSCGAGAIYTLI